MTIVFLILGLALLTVGAEILIRSAAVLAAAVRISPLVVGLTVVAYGTSTPELVVSVQSALSGQTDIALGNVVGSNIFNVLLILGVSALIVPLLVSQRVVRFDVPLMCGLSFLLLILGLDGRLGQFDGFVFVAGLIAYTVWVIAQSRKEQKAVKDEYAQEFGGAEEARSGKRIVVHGLGVLLGLALLVAGSRWFCDAAVSIARSFGVSELVIGLTIVAAGTSLPEVATSVMAALRGERDIAVGNAVGSNLFNIMGVLGLSSIVSPYGIKITQTALQFDIPVMIAVAVACLPIFFTGHVIARWEGGLFFCYYVAYTMYLVLAATNANIRRTFGGIMLGIVLPLTAVTLIIGVYRAVGREKYDREIQSH